MSYEEIIQRRVARELHPGTLVNLGIGLPTGVSQFIRPEDGILFQSENGIVGMGARPPEGMEYAELTDAGGSFVTAVPGAATVDSTLSFGLIRGGHLDATVLGGLEVDEAGHLANWMVPGRMVPGMGGAMDLVTGARRVIVAMQHTARGRPKIVPTCTLPLTSSRRVTLIVTDLAVIEPTDEGLVLRERAPDVSVEDIRKVTTAQLIVPERVPEMDLRANGAN
ncbi:MAG: 3-oxoacid CoA-transferase subunit B [Methylocella sp.]